VVSVVSLLSADADDSLLLSAEEAVVELSVEVVLVVLSPQDAKTEVTIAQIRSSASDFFAFIMKTS
jgi:ethanolamine utilization microcompartment shell protein EutL